MREETLSRGWRLRSLEPAARQSADLPFTEVGHGTPFAGPDGRLWITGHGHVYGAPAEYPYNSPRVCMDPMDFSAATGEFSSQFTWTPQEVRFNHESPEVCRARWEPLGSVIAGFERI